MKFSDLEVLIAQCSRTHGYARDVIPTLWTPGGGAEQQVYSRELAGALLREADEFFDRALMLFLLRTQLRDLQASTWAGVASYYANYFAAVSFVRLSLSSATHLAGGAVFEVSVLRGASPVFTVRQRKLRLGHTDVWRQYYDAIQDMGWPDAPSVRLLSPTVSSLRFREQLYREKINYRPGEGFDEIYLARSRYLSQLKSTVQRSRLGSASMPDAAYTDAMAAERLKHAAGLMRRLEKQRQDKAIEASSWLRRQQILDKYCANRGDRRAADLLLAAN